MKTKLTYIKTVSTEREADKACKEFIHGGVWQPEGDKFAVFQISYEPIRIIPSMFLGY